ncbi:hypothetical protein [Actinomadura rupiterrae]|uniref:hypothetical protein n=1 Tax=Actinomadura rupiterrae TaxID=559627 RepID=UPI0020A5F33B|nr:hypothetical protein [Actinomadura rupiterrae]MCP2338091.1 hypothetical protein [Actinomadura rupiterrae]
MPLPPEPGALEPGVLAADASEPDASLPLVPDASLPCPVCGFVPAGSTCGDCSWTPPDTEDFEACLSEARLRYDLRAAARVGDAARPFVRGVPDDEQWARAGVEAERERTRLLDQSMAAAVPDVGGWTLQFGRPDLSRDPSTWGAQWAFDEVVRHDGAAPVLIDVGADGVSVLVVRPDAVDGPDDPWSVEEHPWERFAAVPLSSDAGERAFQVAGGLHGVDRARLGEALDTGLARIVERLPFGVTTLLVDSAPGWVVPGLALARLSALRPDARIVRSERPAADELADAVARLPLRMPYWLVVGQYDAQSDGGFGAPGAEPVLVPLFPAGTTAGQETVVRVARGPGGADNDVVLAVVAAPEHPPMMFEPRPVSVQATRLPRGALSLRAALDGPGRVRWPDVADLRPDTRPLDQLYAQTRACPAPPAAVEVLCAIELGGQAGQAAARRALLAGTLELIGADLGERAAVSVRGYREHSFELGEERDAVVEGVWKAVPDQALDAFAALPHRTQPYQSDAAPLEDALAEIVDFLERERNAHGWLRELHHPPFRVLAVFAGRPPHPRGQGQDPLRELAQPCPRKDDWRAAADALRRLGVRLVAVLDAATDPDRDYWTALGAHCRLTLEGLTPRALAEAMGIVPPGGASMPFPLLASVPVKGDPA